jgi:hypothetical protein
VSDAGRSTTVPDSGLAWRFRVLRGGTAARLSGRSIRFTEVAMKTFCARLEQGHPVSREAFPRASQRANRE